MRIIRKKPDIMIFQGSPRNINNCPNQDSKTFSLINKIMSELSDQANFDFVNLNITNEKSIIQPCKGCISTAGGYHCHYNCDCYSKNDKEHPDLMHDFDIYDRIEACDGIMVFSPIHWYSVSTQIKAMFDRLVCCNLTLTEELANRILGDDIKNADITRKLEKLHKYDNLLKNHYEGKYAAFFLQGDNGADDYKNRPLPKSFINDDKCKCNDPKCAIMPIVLQCRYSGIYVPDDLIEAVYANFNIDYATANDKVDKCIEIECEFYNKAKSVVERLIKHIRG